MFLYIRWLFLEPAAVCVVSVGRAGEIVVRSVFVPGGLMIVHTDIDRIIGSDLGTLGGSCRLGLAGRTSGHEFSHLYGLKFCLLWFGRDGGSPDPLTSMSMIRAIKMGEHAFIRITNSFLPHAVLHDGGASYSA
jgi:hypothetical protein